VSAKQVDPVARSVHDQLLELAAASKEDFNAILGRYANERILYRLTRTKHGKRFILKGASLFVLWLGRVHRPTRDLDLLGSGKIDPAVPQSVFADVCEVAVEPDGLKFDPASITVAEIREGQEYGGLRVRLRGLMGTARLSVQVDVGIGDAITPTPEEATFPTLLDMPAPALKVYPRETAIAEKLDAMIELGLKNSRMKDYYDIVLLARHFAFDGATLGNAIDATLRRRGRIIPAKLPTGLTDAFGSDPSKSTQWRAFTRGHRAPELPAEFLVVVREARMFLEAPLAAIRAGSKFALKWPPGGPWK
jgi:predicted nucleotidyltransferase component of viral defense system